MPKALEVLKAHHSYPYLFSRERRGERGEFIPPSNSEVRRWFERRGVQMNGEIVAWDQDVSMFSDIVLFPKGGSITLGYVHDWQEIIRYYAERKSMTYMQVYKWLETAGKI